MNSSEKNTLKNEKHYDQQYSKVNIEHIRNIELVFNNEDVTFGHEIRSLRHRMRCNKLVEVMVSLSLWYTNYECAHNWVRFKLRYANFISIPQNER